MPHKRLLLPLPALVVAFLPLAAAVLLPTLLALTARAANGDRTAGDRKVDQAIEHALAFLADTQDRSDGAWRGRSSKNPAIISLAIRAFVSAGHVPGEGKYGVVIE